MANIIILSPLIKIGRLNIRALIVASVVASLVISGQLNMLIVLLATYMQMATQKPSNRLENQWGSPHWFSSSNPSMHLPWNNLEFMSFMLKSPNIYLIHSHLLRILFRLTYCLWPEGLGFESQSPRIAQTRVRLATDTLPQTPHRAGALCSVYALYNSMVKRCNIDYTYSRYIIIALKTNIKMADVYIVLRC